MPKCLLPLVVALVCPSCAGGGYTDAGVRPDTTEEPVYAGVVRVEPPSLSLVGEAGGRVVGPVAVHNDGRYDLTLLAATLPEDADGQLETDAKTNADRTIRSGERFEVLVVCRWQGPGDLSGILRVETDDPGTPSVDVPVNCAAPAVDSDTDE